MWVDVRVRVARMELSIGGRCDDILTRCTTNELTILGRMATLSIEARILNENISERFVRELSNREEVELPKLVEHYNEELEILEGFKRSHFIPEACTLYGEELGQKCRWPLCT